MDVARLTRGAAWGAVATAAKSAVTFLGFLGGESAEPTPMPVAIVERLAGEDAHRALVYPAAALAHLAYGGAAGALFALLGRPTTLVRGVAWGALLWLVQQVVVFPFVGWGAFGRTVGMRASVGALVDHLVYGYVLGVGLERADD